MTISKTVYEFTVLHPTDQPPADLHDAIQEAEGGHAVGNETLISTKVLDGTDVPDELRELGNDGEFFDDDLKEDDA